MTYADPRDVSRGLDRIDVVRAALPSIRTMGYMFERTTWLHRLVGFRDGVIYVPFSAPVKQRVRGESLRDVIRHESGHAWAWMNPGFFRRRWFRETFMVFLRERRSLERLRGWAGLRAIKGRDEAIPQAERAARRRCPLVARAEPSGR